jgi:phage terminase large subunit-like protein
VSGVLSVAKRRRHRVKWEPSIGRLRWPNGSEAQLFSGDNPDGLRGPEHDFAWCDELAKWREAEAAWMNLQMGLRRGSRPRALVTTTPRPIDLLKRIREAEWTVTTTGRTDENVNLDDKFVQVMTATYGATRIGRQELDGELIEEIEGSLWPRELMEKARASLDFARDERALDRIVVGVDPPAGVGAGCDACGIVVCGRRGDDLYVLADETVEGLTPEGWANRVSAAAARWGASIVVAEANNGGAMVASVLKAADCPVKVKLVHASKGKVARAEPVALRFEAGKAFLAGWFPSLEDQMAGMIAGGEYQGPGRSPDRADAMVWAMTELGETRSGLPRVRRL